MKVVQSTSQAFAHLPRTWFRNVAEYHLLLPRESTHTLCQHHFWCWLPASTAADVPQMLFTAGLATARSYRSLTQITGACAGNDIKRKGATTAKKYGLREPMGSIDVFEIESLKPLDRCVKTVTSSIDVRTVAPLRRPCGNIVAANTASKAAGQVTPERAFAWSEYRGCVSIAQELCKGGKIRPCNPVQQLSALPQLA